MIDLLSSKDLLKFQISALKIVMMWPTRSVSLLKNIGTKALYFVNVIILAVCTVGLFIKAINTDDLVNRSEAMDIFTLTGSALYKMMFFYHYHKEFVDMATAGLAFTPHLPTGWGTYAALFSFIHCALGFTTLFLWALCPIAKFLFGEITLKDMSLPLNVYDPFDSEGISFVLIYLVCTYGILISGQIYMAADGYLFTSIHLANGAFQGLYQKLKNMDTIVKSDTGNNGSDEMNEYLIDCIKLHSQVLRFIRKTDKLFRSMILADVLHAIISLSFALLQTTESKGIAENMKMTVFMAYCFIHQFLNSHFGQQMIDQQYYVNEQVLVSVPWTEGSRTLKKSYHIMTSGTKATVKLSAWGVYNLQYGTFIEFVKSMISYYMVLKQLQDDAQG